jgi:Domain of unknown function (DUF4411)
MSRVKYLLDSDVLISAYRGHYSPEFCQPFWNWLLAANDGGVVYTIDRVLDELRNGHPTDYLHKLANDYGDKLGIITKNDESCLERYAEIQEWANTVWSGNKDPNKIRKALEIFAVETIADPWLVACALVGGYEIVTNEESALASLNIVKLPDCANAFGVTTHKLTDILKLHSTANFEFKP